MPLTTHKYTYVHSHADTHTHTHSLSLSLSLSEGHLLHAEQHAPLEGTLVKIVHNRLLLPSQNIHRVYATLTSATSVAMVSVIVMTTILFTYSRALGK